MKTTGVVRKVDELGRVVLPISMRHNLGIEERDPLEILVEGDRIVLQKYRPACIFCGGSEEIIFYNEKRICGKCLAEIKATL